MRVARVAGEDQAPVTAGPEVDVQLDREPRGRELRDRLGRGRHRDAPAGEVVLVGRIQAVGERHAEADPQLERRRGRQARILGRVEDAVGAIASRIVSSLTSPSVGVAERMSNLGPPHFATTTAKCPRRVDATASRGNARDHNQPGIVLGERARRPKHLFDRVHSVFRPIHGSAVEDVRMDEREAEILRGEFDRCRCQWRDAIDNGRGSYVADSWRWRAEQTLEIAVALGVIDRVAGELRIRALRRARPGPPIEQDPNRS